MKATFVRARSNERLFVMSRPGFCNGHEPVWQHAIRARTSRDFDAAAEYRKGMDALKASQIRSRRSSFARVLGVAPNDANTNFLAGMADAGLNDFKARRQTL